MKAGWQTKTLEEACEFSNGLWKGEKEPFVNVGVIRNTNFTKEGALDDSDIAYLDVEVKKFEKRRLQFGDIILEKSGGGPKQPVGRVALFDKNEGLYSFSNFTSAIRVKNPNELDFRFLHKHLFWTYLSGVTEGMQSHSTGIRNLDGNAYKTIQIAIPPLPEQHRIVAILDEAFNGIATAKANAEKNLQNACALFESHLQSVFKKRDEEWLEQTLGEVFTTATGTTPAKNNADFYGDFMPLVKPPELCDAPFDSASDGLSEAGAAVARTLPEKSILVSCIGKLGKIGMNTVPVAFNQQINAILPNETHAIPEFMFFQSLAPVFKDQLESLASGTTVPIVNKSKFNSVRVVLPPLSVQKSVVAKLAELREETQRLESIYQRKLTALDELKKSLLHQAFSGQL